MKGFEREAAVTRAAIDAGLAAAQRMRREVPNLDRTVAVLTCIATAVALMEEDGLSKEEFAGMCGNLFEIISGRL